MKYPVIVADPPWRFECWTDALWSAGNTHKKRTEHHYQTREANWIETLPVAAVAAEDCALLLWITWPIMPQALNVIAAWGFEYKTLAFDWIKTTQDGRPKMGLGYYTRANSEPCLLATRGKPKRLDKGVSQVLACGTGRHSEKPFEFYGRVERLLAGPYLELFSRPWGSLIDGSREGWTRLGNEMDGLDMAEALRRVARIEDPATCIYTPKSGTDLSTQKMDQCALLLDES